MIIHTRSSKKVKVKNKPGYKLAQKEYEEWLKKHQSAKSVISAKSIPTISSNYLAIPAGRDTKHIPSLNSTGAVNLSKKKSQVYTGDKMLGIGTLHKSNAVPVFSSDEAKAMAQMRR